MRPPWQIPDDPERKAMRPSLDFRERLRLGLKVPIPFVAYLWFQSEQSGPRALVAFASTLCLLSLIELVWLPSTTQAERIFTKTRRQAAVLHVTVVAASAAALVASVPRLP
jgi:hypothetical protein